MLSVNLTKRTISTLKISYVSFSCDGGSKVFDTLSEAIYKAKLPVILEYLAVDQVNNISSAVWGTLRKNRICIFCNLPQSSPLSARLKNEILFNKIVNALQLKLLQISAYHDKLFSDISCLVSSFVPQQDSTVYENNFHSCKVIREDKAINSLMLKEFVREVRSKMPAHFNSSNAKHVGDCFLFLSKNSLTKNGNFVDEFVSAFFNFSVVFLEDFNFSSHVSGEKLLGICLLEDYNVVKCIAKNFIKKRNLKLYSELYYNDVYKMFVMDENSSCENLVLNLKRIIDEESVEFSEVDNRCAVLNFKNIVDRFGEFCDSKNVQQARGVDITLSFLGNSSELALAINSESENPLKLQVISANSLKSHERKNSSTIYGSIWNCRFYHDAFYRPVTAEELSTLLHSLSLVSGLTILNVAFLYTTNDKKSYEEVLWEN